MKKINVILLMIIVIFLIFPQGMYAQITDHGVKLNISARYSDMPVNKQYLQMKKLIRKKRDISATEGTKIVYEQLSAEIGVIKNSLRTDLFRQKEKIYNLYKLRYELFSEILAKKEQQYEVLKGSHLTSDIVKCDKLFAHIQTLEIKIATIEKVMKKVKEDLFKERAAKEAFTLLEELDHVHRDDFAGKVKIKQKMLILLREVVVTLHYPTDAIDMIDRAMKNVNEFLGTYSYWDEVSEKDEPEMIKDYNDTEEASRFTKSRNDFETVGRRNYMDTIVKKSKDMRKGTKVKTKNIYKSANQATDGMNVKDKVRDN
ncbi:hypothetical protein ACFL3D_00690 [Candidatus Omnitrophota bacterium]